MDKSSTLFENRLLVTRLTLQKLLLRKKKENLNDMGWVKINLWKFDLKKACWQKLYIKYIYVTPSCSFMVSFCCLHGQKTLLLLFYGYFFFFSWHVGGHDLSAELPSCKYLILTQKRSFTVLIEFILSSVLTKFVLSCFVYFIISLTELTIFIVCDSCTSHLKINLILSL